MPAADSTLSRTALPQALQGQHLQGSLYRQYFTPAECRLIDSTPLGDALTELGLIRIMVLRILAAAHRAERLPAAAAHSDDMRRRSLTLERRLAMLQAFSHAGLAMASLVRLHHRLSPPTNPLLDALAEMDPDDI